VKEAMLHDMGSRDFAFIKLVKKVREHLLYLAGVSAKEGFDAVIIQGSGTFSLESVLSSTIAQNDHLLVLINGAYGKRIHRIAELHKIHTSQFVSGENSPPDIRDLEEFLESNPSVTHIAMVHCETTTGIINPLTEVGRLCREYGKIFIVDAMSSFGAVSINLREAGIDFLVSSSNKCIEGIPGFAFVLARLEHLRAAKELARTLTLDLHAQWQGLEDNGQFRFTPPVQAILAFNEALEELYEEGGIEARASRYKKNYEILTAGMDTLGFKSYLEKEYQSYIITSFLYPAHPEFSFEKFYSLLNERGFVIYPGKLSKVDCFRIGTIGRLNSGHVEKLLEAIEQVLKEMECYPL
jgi:2-aminoethylphosphonate-pyruvate transaminase